MSELTWRKYLESIDTPSAGSEPAPVEPLVPNVDLPLSEPVTYRTIAITSLPEVADEHELNSPVDLLAVRTPTQGWPQPIATAPAEGAIVTHEQAWRLKGVTLGRLLHSITLAPGEVTQVALTEWQRSTTGGSTEDIGAEERSARSAGRTRDVHQVTNEVANETQRGRSEAGAASARADVGVGGVLGLLGGSASGSVGGGVASSVSYNSGSRGLAATSNGTVKQSTQQHASNVRGQRATVVQEVRQSETERFETRVIANYNHMHALNVLYFEVLQVYELSTEAKNPERCIFLPFEPITFDTSTIRTFARPLARAASTAGLEVLAEGIALHGSDDGAKAQRFKRLRERATQSALRRDAAAAGVAASDVELEAASRQLDTSTQAVATANRDVDRASSALASAERREEQIIQQDGLFAAHIGALQKQLRSLSDIVNPFAEAEHLKQLLELERRRTELKSELTAQRAEGARMQTDLNAANSERANAVSAHAAAVERRDAARVAAKTAQDRFARWQERASEDAANQSLTERADKQTDADIIAQLNDRGQFFNQALWAQMDPDQLASTVAGRTHAGVSLLETIDPTPVAVTGNYVGFRWNFPPDQPTEAAEFRARVMADSTPSEPLDTVVLPTGGVFAEAVLGRANSAEKLDLTRLWKWDDTTIPILPTAIDSLHHVDRAARAEVRPGQLGPPALAAQPLPEAPPLPSNALAAMIGTSMFRDISGGDVIEGLLDKAQQVTGDGAAAAQEAAHKNVAAYLDHVEQLLPTLTKAMKSGSKPDLTTLGALQNSLGEEGGGALDVEGLLAKAAEMGLFL